MKKLLLLSILPSLFSCSSDVEQENLPPDLYPTEKCTLIFQGTGSTGSTTKTIDLVKRGYYEVVITNSNNIFLEVSNPKSSCKLVVSLTD